MSAFYFYFILFVFSSFFFSRVFLIKQMDLFNLLRGMLQVIKNWFSCVFKHKNTVENIVKISSDLKTIHFLEKLNDTLKSMEHSD